ncbi:glycerophosphodiester phosphodiesterase domain-containing protein 4 [Tupaia chinensis]|uniref:glycerophosphodiester phosphodiesterase domain-containing protein 4 n=1 Tax=Tupaia chinensis TaxID=246437 RepID=UPI0003C8E399|nr:glycerophosphodiester phosphodiesterase domain-containing protein 4 [Tupaia chinensis]
MLKPNKIDSERKKKGKKKKINSWIAHLFDRRRYITFLTGCYSCRWKFRKWEKTKLGSCCCTRTEQVFCAFLTISFVMSVIWLFVWLEISNEYFGFDWVVFLGTGFWFFWSIVFLSLSGILTAYSSLLLLLAFLLLWEQMELYLHWCHKILILLVILLCSFFFFLVFRFWKDKWLTAGLSLQIFAPYLHMGFITVMVLLSWPVAFYVARLEREVRIRRYKTTCYEKEKLKKCNIFTRLRALQLATGLPFLLILACLYLIPLGIYSPCIQEKEDLGPKPVFFGHRGAPMLGPENTMMSFEKAVEQEAYGLESDVFLSYDGVPFLMHDYDVRRTTNIREVLPKAAFNHSSSFKWNFLATLNAGEWFVQPWRKPFYDMKTLSEADKKKARNQSIPKLYELLQFAQKKKKFVIFDLNGCPPKHPFRNAFVRQTVKVILDSKIEQHLIFWLSGHDRAYVRHKAPGFQQVGRLYSVERLTKENISIINVDYKRLFFSGLRHYKAANITINLYIVNEPWLFSLAWCSRINSVTTDNISLLRRLNHPHYFMTPRDYMLIWLLTDGVSAVFIIAVFYFHWWREMKKEKALETSSLPTDCESISLPEEEGESHETVGLSVNPGRTAERPWTLAALHPALAKGGKKHEGTSHFVVASMKSPNHVQKTVTPLMATKHDVKPTVPTQTLEHTQAPTAETTKVALPQMTSPTLKEADAPAMPSVVVHHPEKQTQETPMAQSSKETFLTI